MAFSADGPSMQHRVHGWPRRSTPGHGSELLASHFGTRSASLASSSEGGLTPRLVQRHHRNSGGQRRPTPLDQPAKPKGRDSAVSISTRRLYFATRSPRAGAPLFSCPQPEPTARSAMKVSSDRK